MKKILTFVLAAIMALCVFAPFAYSEEEDIFALAFADTRFELTYENEYAFLLMDARRVAFRVVCKETGAFFDTKPQPQGVAAVQNVQNSNFIIEYMSNLHTGDGGRRNVYRAWSDSINLNQTEIHMLEDGVRIDFTIGDLDRVLLSDFPMFISSERMHALVFDHNDPAIVATWIQRPGVVMDGGVFWVYQGGYYRRRFDCLDEYGDPTSVSPPVLNRMWQGFYGNGLYTPEELAYDNAYWSFVPEDSRRWVEVSMSYRLDGPDLVVTFYTSGMVVVSDEPERTPIINVTVHPHLISGRNDQSGYIFVPDGSGAIIRLDALRDAPAPMNMPVWGGDIFHLPWFFEEQFIQTTLPVYGVVWEDTNTAVLAIIEQGASAATIHATAAVADPFARAFTSFVINEMQEVPLLARSAGWMHNTRPMFHDTPFNEDIIIRYVFLQGDRANYVGMAKAFQAHLMAHGQLYQRIPNTPDAPFFVNLIAGVPVIRTFAGLIPYDTYETLTSA
ncbi:MAG: DUF5696 domain-containing protein, partial [Defluviitaleaceae bacterium]|nr:DUF5696 domain-containing protein [Defluviitaleaceae bacterium]